MPAAYSFASASSVHVIDSHTAGEPTRVVLSGGPDLGTGPLSDRLLRLREQHDHFRSAVVAEPRGSQVLVGALLCPAQHPSNAAGVLFFNDVGYLGMCGHGTIGLVVTLAHLGRIGLGRHGIETPVGTVHATLHEGGRVTVENVPSYRYARQVTVVVTEIPGAPVEVVGDIAWGGNWFFLVDYGVFGADAALEHGQVRALSVKAAAVRQALAASGIRGEAGALIDHIAFYAPAADPANHARSFVLCPGGSFDRSPCGTGTSAKVACLAAEGKLARGRAGGRRVFSAPSLRPATSGLRMISPFHSSRQGQLSRASQGRRM